MDWREPIGIVEMSLAVIFLQLKPEIKIGGILADSVWRSWASELAETFEWELV